MDGGYFFIAYKPGGKIWAFIFVNHIEFLGDEREGPLALHLGTGTQLTVQVAAALLKSPLKPSL